MNAISFSKCMSAQFALVGTVGLPRLPQLFSRRLFKLGEELGEVSEAYLAITGEHNYKGLTAADLREETVDVLLIAVDLAFAWLQPLALSQEQCNKIVTELFVESSLNHAPASAFEANLGHVYKAYGKLITKFSPGLPEGSDAVRALNPSQDFAIPDFLKTVGALAMTAVPGEPCTTSSALQQALVDQLGAKIQKWARVTGKSVSAFEPLLMVA